MNWSESCLTHIASLNGNFWVERFSQKDCVLHWDVLQSCSKICKSALCEDSEVCGFWFFVIWLGCAVYPLFPCYSYEHEVSLLNLYFLGTYFNTIVIDFTIQNKSLARLFCKPVNFIM